jgi:hypothetical protein
MSEPSRPIPPDDLGLPVVEAGPPPVRLPADAPEALAALDQALAGSEPGPALREVAARWPGNVEVWARLSDLALRAGQTVEAYAFARTGYHRGLDLLRRNGWRGMGPVPWAHQPNQAVLRAIQALGLASAALGDRAEADRCRQLLLECDPTQPLELSR